jgi:hypothetical protein
VDAIQAETPDRPLPFKVDMSDAGDSISTARVVLFTGKRIVNSFRLHAPPGAADSLAAADAAPAADPSQPASGKRSRIAAAGGSDDVVQQHNTSAVAASQGASAGAPAPPVRQLVAIMSGQAPPRLTVREVTELAEACKYYMADSIVDMLPAYFAPVFDDAPLAQVSSSTQSHKCQRVFTVLSSLRERRQRHLSHGIRACTGDTERLCPSSCAITCHSACVAGLLHLM